MANVITPDLIDEPVRRFFDRLDVSSEPSMIEINGRRVYVVVRPAREAMTSSESWTDAKAERRHRLIDLKLASTLTPLEAVELAELNEEFDRHLNRVAPLPIENARELLRKLTSANDSES